MDAGGRDVLDGVAGAARDRDGGDGRDATSVWPCAPRQPCAQTAALLDWAFGSTGAALQPDMELAAFAAATVEELQVAAVRRPLAGTEVLARVRCLDQEL